MYLFPSLRGAAEAIQTKTHFYLDCRASLAMTIRKSGSKNIEMNRLIISMNNGM